MPMYERLEIIFKKLPYTVEYIYVDNDSTDGSRSLLERLAQKDQKVKVLFMSRNFGSPQPSFLAGLIHANCDGAILLQGDIQDPPEIIPKFIEQWEKGYE